MKYCNIFFADAEIGDDAVFHWANGGNVAWSTAQHTLGFGTDSDDALLIAVSTNGNDRGFIQDDTALTHVNKGVGSAQVDG
ncbi:hypothetical protein TOC8171_26390 [Pseudomonas syringae]